MGWNLIVPTRDGETSGTQTTERLCADEAVQTCDLLSVGTETEDATLGPVAYDEKALADFLRKVAPLVGDELETDADFSEIDRDGSEEESSLVRLNVYEAPKNTAQVRNFANFCMIYLCIDSQMKISSLSWNNTGGTLAAAFSAVRHDAWCNHESQVVLYRMASKKSAQPRTYLTPSCVTCIQFHPTEPSLIAAGLYNGRCLIFVRTQETGFF